ncbi:MAG: hypothetical protein IT318_23840 [Anaerolineales bacterium]|nr:hypothetical protein [Anaerolineales bacterium]
MTTQRPPTGKGYFVWIISRCAGGDPARLAAMARGAGLAWVALKIADGTVVYNGDPAAHVAALQSAGVAVWGWSYVYGRAPVVEAGRAVERVRRYGLAGYLINAEAEYKAPGMGARAREFVQALREVEPGLAVGLCSYRYPSLHPTFPWAEFLAGCNFHAPQLYWLEDSRPAAPALQLARSLDELRARRDLPVVPIGVASPNDAGSWYPAVAQLDNFDEAAHALGLPGVGWWSWQHAERQRDFWAAIAAHRWDAPAPPADPDSAEKARVLAHAEAILTELR